MTDVSNDAGVDAVGDEGPAATDDSQESRTAVGPGGGNVEVWGDLVSVRDLVLSLAIAVIAVAAATGMSAVLRQPPLFWGLGGAVVGFVVNTLLVRPKRDVRIVDGAGRPYPGTSAEDGGRA